jgi:hypothetical protein
MAAVRFDWLFFSAIAKKIAINIANAPEIAMERDIAKTITAVAEIASDV